MTDSPAPDPVQLAGKLRDQGVVGVTIAWIDNNGITRSRTVPVDELPAAAARGVGVTAVFAVFDSHDGITFAHEGLSTPSGDVRLVPVLETIVPLAGQPGLAFAMGRQLDADGAPWPYDQRAVLERQVARAAEAGFEVRAGFEIEMVLSRAEAGDDVDGAHRGPAYGPKAMLDVDELVRQLLADLAANGLEVGQLHAEYGAAQLELSLSPRDAVAAADAQVLVRQTVHAAARAHGLRASFAPVVTTDNAGNGWHLHTSLVRPDGTNALAGDGEHGLSDVGRGYLAGILRELPAVVAVTAPSLGSLVRRRPGFWAGAYGCWGVQNREAALRLVPPSGLLGPEVTNVELKPSDASANPYLAIATVVAAGLAGVADGASLPEPVQDDPATLDAAEAERLGVVPLATTHEDQLAALTSSPLIRDVLGDALLGAFVAVREADAAWAADRTHDEVVASLRWLY